MRRNNGGFTFVELIVGIVIFAIVAAAAPSFLAAGSKTYARVNSAMNQRLDGQLALNQIESYLIECDGSLSFKDDTLSIVSSAVDGSEKTYVFKLSDGELLFGENGAVSATNLLADNVTAFDVAFYPIAAVNASSAKISLTTEKRGKTLTLEKTVALRNHPQIAQ